MVGARPYCREMDSYKRLVAWQRASEFSLAVLEAVDSAWSPRAAVLFDQLRRAALSVDVNIVEGYALNTRPLIRRHRRIAIGSAAEAERLLVIATTRGYLPEPVAHSLEAMIQTVFPALVGLAN